MTDDIATMLLEEIREQRSILESQSSAIAAIQQRLVDRDRNCVAHSDDFKTLRRIVVGNGSIEGSLVGEVSNLKQQNVFRSKALWTLISLLCALCVASFSVVATIAAERITGQ